MDAVEKIFKYLWIRNGITDKQQAVKRTFPNDAILKTNIMLDTYQLAGGTAKESEGAGGNVFWQCLGNWSGVARNPGRGPMIWPGKRW